MGLKEWDSSWKGPHLGWMLVTTSSEKVSEEFPWAYYYHYVQHIFKFIILCILSLYIDGASELYIFVE